MEGVWNASNGRTRRGIASARLVRHWPGAVGACVLILVATSALAAPVLAPFNPTQQDLMARLTPPLGTVGIARHLLGTDQLGRDVLSRIIYGSRVSLGVSMLSVLGSGLLGVTLGLWAGYTGGWVDTFVMRLVELQLAFPVVILALAIIAMLGPNPANLVVVFIVTAWPVYAQTVRSTVRVVTKQDFVEAARALGNTDARLLVRHVLPNMLSPLIVVVSFELARLIILEASLGFLGLGIQPPTPTWGNMLAEGRDYLGQGWWVATFPGLAISLTVGAVNFLGDALRDVLDPRLRGV